MAARAKVSFESFKIFGIFRTFSNVTSADLSSPSSHDASVLNKFAHQRVNGSSQSAKITIHYVKNKMNLRI